MPTTSSGTSTSAVPGISYIHPYSMNFGRISCVKFSFIIHLDERSIPSEKEYIFMDWHQLQDDHPRYRKITHDWSTNNPYRSYELNARELQARCGLVQSSLQFLALGAQVHPKANRFIPITPNAISTI